MGELAEGLRRRGPWGPGGSGTLRIGFAASLALTVLPGMLARFRERYPEVRLELREMTTAPQITALGDGTLDVGLLREPGEEDPTLAFRTVAEEAFVAVLPGGHPLAVGERVNVADLADAPFILLPREAGPRLHDQIVELCVGAGFTPGIAQRAVEWQTVCALVGAGLGVSRLAPAGIARIRLDGVAFRPIEPDEARTRVAAGWRREDRNPVLANFLELVAA